MFNDTATTEIYTHSLHDALPISGRPDRAGHGHNPRPFGHAPKSRRRGAGTRERGRAAPSGRGRRGREDRKSTRLNSSHANISYAVFCLKKKGRGPGADREKDLTW